MNMAKHTLWDADEVREQVESEFDALHERIVDDFAEGMFDLMQLHDDERAAFKSFCELVKL